MDITTVTILRSSRLPRRFALAERCVLIRCGDRRKSPEPSCGYHFSVIGNHYARFCP